MQHLEKAPDAWHDAGPFWVNTIAAEPARNIVIVCESPEAIDGVARRIGDSESARFHTHNVMRRRLTWPNRTNVHFCCLGRLDGSLRGRRPDACWLDIHVIDRWVGEWDILRSSLCNSRILVPESVFDLVSTVVFQP